MNESSTLTRPQVVFGKLGRLHLPQLPGIEGQGAAPRWDRQDFVAAFQSSGTAGAVAEINGRVVGFALYQVAPPADGIGLGDIKRLLRWCWPWKADALASLQHVDLLRIGVLAEWQRQGIGRSLLERLHQEFRRSGCRIQAIVPESNLPAQLFLKDAGYKAVRILPGHYGGEDGYLMERQCS
jgi:ribosomal protein S18 acetylase RimI-like enzyme